MEERGWALVVSPEGFVDPRSAVVLDHHPPHHQQSHLLGMTRPMEMVPEVARLDANAIYSHSQPLFSRLGVGPQHVPNNDDLHCLPPLPASVKAPKPRRVKQPLKATLVPVAPGHKIHRPSMETGVTGPELDSLQEGSDCGQVQTKADDSAGSTIPNLATCPSSPPSLQPSNHGSHKVEAQQETTPMVVSPQATSPSSLAAAPLVGTTPPIPASLAPGNAQTIPLHPTTIVPKSTPMVHHHQSKVRQLAKFMFPKNTNMVLVVDDNGVNRKLIGKMLSYFNLEYQAAEHGREAVELMERSQNVTGDTAAPSFGLVLMDLCMPVMDGYQAIRTLRNELNLQELPIVALTASAMEDEKQKALDAGATEFATKPLLRPALHKKCEEYLRRPLTDGSSRQRGSLSSMATAA